MKKTTKKKMPEKNAPLTEKEAVLQSNDEHIDQDFPGYPHPPSSENMINPKTKKDRVASGNDTLPGDGNEVYSVGSAGAFEAAEKTADSEGDDSLFRKNK